jgi:hypothetical protein
MAALPADSISKCGSRETDFDFVLSAQLTIFNFDLLCAFASLRDAMVGFRVF